MDSLCLKAGIHGVAAPIAVAGGASVDVRASLPSHFKASLSIPQRNSSWRLSFRKSRCAGSRRRFGAVSAGDDVVLIDENDEERNAEEQNDNWVMKILRVRSLRNGGGCGLGDSQAEKIEGQFSDADDICAVDDDDHHEIEFDRNSFSKLLCRVSLKEARLYAQMSYLGNLAYSIPQIKPRNLLRYHGLRFVTSSLEKKEQALKAEREMALSEEQMKKEEEVADMDAGDVKEHEGDRTSGIGISASAAYQIAASAASYLLSHTKSILPFKSPQVDGDTPKRTIGRDENVDFRNEEVASLMATTDSVTAVVAAKEEVKQAVADDLSSTRLSPCQWFVCDDDRSATRFFVIQGSESLASWQADLLFEPTQFEGMDVLVHRGIYEAAKGMYEQMLPEVRDHLKSYGDRALFRFTGHSLGGSLSLLVSLMLLTREEVPPSSLLPVITFGSPTIMCGGDRLLKKLGLPRSHVQSIMMHRDIVPRAFSCSYPIHVAELLKAVNGSFRNHPCLNNQKLLYAPMGDFLILQPNDKFSPSHHLLPSGPGLYLLSCPLTDDEAEKRILSAKSVFLNSPHPLEILSDRSAYGSGGAIQRDHDMKSYLKCIRNIIREELSRIRKAKREHRRRVWWPLIVIPGVNNAGIVVGKLAYQGQFSFAGMFHSGKESVKRFTVVAGQHMHLFLMFLLPAPLLILRVFNVISFR